MHNLSKIKNIFLLLCCTLLSGCQLTLLDPKGLIAYREKYIMLASALLMLMVVITVIILLFVFAWQFRAGNSEATYEPNWSHHTLLEVIWWSIPCVIIAILATITWITSHQLDPYKPLNADNDKTITIQAIALEWKWLFIYPDQHIATVNFVEFPVNVPVQFLISAEGPMNSFQIPQLAGQIYAMAGMQSKLNLIANTKGDYRGISANFSGKGFSGMKFIARVSSKDEFARWITTVKQSNLSLTMDTYNKLLQQSENNPVTYFNSPDQTIYATVLMKTMMPKKDIANLCNPKLQIVTR